MQNTQSQNTQSQNTLDNLLPELKLEVILHLSNPSPLAKCSREWYSLVNLPYVKSKWLIRTYTATHALVNAIRLGEPFINPAVVQCLLAQKANISRYTVQLLKAGFEERANLNGRRPWGSHLTDDTYSFIMAEAYKRYRNDDGLCDNDMERFYFLSGGPSTIHEAKSIIKQNLDEIMYLIQTCKFVPFPSRSTSDVQPYPSTYGVDQTWDGFENGPQVHILARAVLWCPKLIGEWARIGYTNITSDTNDLVVQGMLQILFPKITRANWVPPTVLTVVKRLNDLISLGFDVWDGVLVDGLLMFREKVVDVGSIIIEAFAAVRHLTIDQVLDICLDEILNPKKKLQEHYLLDFIVDRVDDPEIRIISIFRKYGVIDDRLTSDCQIPLSRTFLKYPAPVYRFMVIKFGVKAQIVRHLMKQLVVGRVGISQHPNSIAHGKKWRDLVIIFNEYYNINVPFEPEDLSVFKSCYDEFIIKSLFEGYLPKLFGYKGGYDAPMTLRTAVLMPVTPLLQASLKRRKGAKKAKTELQKQWVEACNQQLKNEDVVDNVIFKRALQRFLQLAQLTWEPPKPKKKGKRTRLG